MRPARFPPDPPAPLLARELARDGRMMPNGKLEKTLAIRYTCAILWRSGKALRQSPVDKAVFGKELLWNRS